MTVILGIDPGALAGAAILTGGRLHMSDEIKRNDVELRRLYVRQARDQALKRGEDLLVWREKWQAGGAKFGPSVSAGLGMSWGQWFEVILQEIPGLPKSRLKSVYPATWRSNVLQCGRNWENVARIYVEGRFESVFEVDEEGNVKKPDELTAQIIACHGHRSDEAKKLSSNKSAPRWHKAFQ